MDFREYSCCRSLTAAVGVYLNLWGTNGARWIEVLPPTGPDAVVDGRAADGRGPRLRGSADAAEAEGVQPPREHPSQDTAAGGAAVVRVDDGKPVPRSPLQVEVIVV